MNSELAAKTIEDLEWMITQVREHGVIGYPESRKTADAWNPADGTYYGVVRCGIEFLFDTKREIPGDPEPMNLPSDSELVYVVGREAYYADALRTAHPEPYLSVMADATDGQGCAWEFNITEHNFRNSRETAVQLEMFQDSFIAFREIPEFFAALTAQEPRTLREVRAILDGMGARDTTPRTWQEDPEARRRSVEVRDDA